MREKYLEERLHPLFRMEVRNPGKTLVCTDNGEVDLLIRPVEAEELLRHQARLWHHLVAFAQALDEIDPARFNTLYYELLREDS